MKVSLVVATGAHQGKVVPIVGTQFLIGRDPQCQLRPASQAVSKQHCAVILRDGKVYLKDFGSTNGTLLNDEIVQDDERELTSGDALKIGPLDFMVSIELSEAKPDGTPLPDFNPEAAAALAAVQAVSAAAPPTSSKNSTPVPGKAAVPAKDAKAVQSGSKKSAALSASADLDTENDRLAAMLLGLDDEEVPGGSTVVDVMLPPEVAAAGKEPEKATDKKAIPTREGTSNAASDILRKYMRRPK